MIEKKIQELTERLRYIKDITEGRFAEDIDNLDVRFSDFCQGVADGSIEKPMEEVSRLESAFLATEKNLDSQLTAMDRVRIVRHPQRICLRDILENVYDNYTEVGGQEEHSTDPAMIIARATLIRHRGKKKYRQLVMVIGQEKGHGEDFRNGGSAKPWGNAKARHYMRVAETENIPIHTYVFTPGAYPIEDYPGAARQIAQNIYEMAGISVPIVSVISEGGSGGAEAIALADRRLMFSHGYYSVISPEGAAAIEGHGVSSPELVSECAANLHITAEDNLRFGYIDRIIHEPYLGARVSHFDFFRTIRQEVLRATDEAVSSVRAFGFTRKIAIRRIAHSSDMDKMYLNWALSDDAREKLVLKRQKKFLALSQAAYQDNRPAINRIGVFIAETWKSISSQFKYVVYTRHQKQIATTYEEIASMLGVFKDYAIYAFTRRKKTAAPKAESVQELTALSDWKDDAEKKGRWAYVSPRAREDKSVSCPNEALHGCFDIWCPDLYGEFAGVCPTCGHHFPMEYQWFINNIFDIASIREFNTEIEAVNPLQFPHLSEALEKAKAKTGLLSSCITFEASLNEKKLICAVLVGSFRGGTVGAAEGFKFVEAAQLARKKRYPLLVYVHGTAGIRIQEGTHGVIQMPRCTVAVRQYIEAGGLYIVVYDTNSYAGPVASFLGASPYQYAMRSSNLGFAGPSVIRETTGIEVPPHYHSAYKALARGHIQGVWDRREVRANLQQLLLTADGRNIY